MDPITNCPRGKVPMWPPNGGQEPTYFLERHVAEKLNIGWTLSPKRPSPPARVTPPTPRRALARTTDKPKQEEQGTEVSE